jgi:hypothetical protein
VPSAPAGQEDLADQAALVQEIGAEASRGFDPEAHARALRAQIEALIGKPVAAKAVVAPASAPGATGSGTSAAVALLAPVAKPVLAPALPAMTSASASGPSESVVRDAIQKLESVLDNLKTEVNREAKDK